MKKTEIIKSVVLTVIVLGSIGVGIYFLNKNNMELKKRTADLAASKANENTSSLIGRNFIPFTEKINNNEVKERQRYCII